ncbi:MAG: TonB-dependent receptor domain-containing protein [Terriglobales bacterium]
MNTPRALSSGVQAILLAGLLWSGPTAAQIQNGDIVGLVTDVSGAVLPNAAVSVSNLETNRKVTVRSNETGLYSAGQLISGTYILTVSAAGFAISTSGQVKVRPGTALRLDFTLRVAGRPEAVEIRSASPSVYPVDTENARLSTTLDSTQVADLPLNGRNLYDLVQYVPGAVNVRGVIFEDGSQAVVNGVRENFGGYLVNGLPNRGLSGGIVNRPIVDTIQQVQVFTLNNSAEFGSSAGAVTSLVTKSGTNHFHGSSWWFLRNDAVDANSFFANHDPIPTNRVKPGVRLNQFGLAIGGPVWKNRLFFFAAYQGERFVTSSPGVVLAESPQLRRAVEETFPTSVASLLYSKFAPSASGTPAFTSRDYVVGGRFSGSGFTRFADYLCPAATDGTGTISNRFASLFGVEQADIDQMNLPEADSGCPGGSPYSAPVIGALNRDDPLLVNVLSVTPSQTDGDFAHGNEGSLRLDYIFGPADSLFAQTNWSRSTDQFGGGNLVRRFPMPIRLTAPNFQLSYIHTLNPNLLNEFRAGYTGSISTTDTAFPGVPSISFDDSTLGFGAGSEYPETFRESIYTYADSLSLNHGKHKLKAGVDLHRNIENSNINTGRPSYYFFDPLFFAVDAPYGQWAGVDPGIISGKLAHLEPVTRHWRNWEIGPYFQDDWKITRRLALNLGIRYDLYTRLTELNNLGTTFLKGPGHNFIDDITTGAGQIKNASEPCLGNPLATIAGVCGPGGFAPAKSLGAGDHNNFGPRLGFAWDMFGNGKTSLRGGFGISYQSAIYAPYSNTRWNPPYYSLDQAFNALLGNVNHVVYGPVGGEAPTFLGPAPAAQHSGTGAQATGNISGWDPSNPNIGALTSIIFPEGIPDPAVKSYFLGVQRAIRRNLTAEANYVGTSASDLIRAEDVNRVPGGLLPEGTCVRDNLDRLLCSQLDSRLNPYGQPNNLTGRLNPNFGNLRVWRDIADSNYNSLQLSLQGRLDRGLQLSANYTFSHSIDSGSSWHSGNTTVNGFAAGDGYTTDQTQPGLDRGNSTYDVRHRLTVSYTWEPPFFLHRKGFVRTVLAGWQANGIWAFQSGAHWTPFDPRRMVGFQELAPGACVAGTFDAKQCISLGGDYNLDGERNDRPSAVEDHVNATRTQWADGFNLPANFFFAPCLACTGNLGRNTFVGPGYWAADVSIFKNFKLTEPLHLQFRAESFNVLNHTNFQIGNNAINDPVFGQAGGTANPRNLQFALKLIF